jgi:hypothetical protein
VRYEQQQSDTDNHFAGSRRGRPPQSSTARLELAGVGAEARRWASVILEVLAGLRSPPQAAQALGVSLPRYSAGELRALHGLLAACQPRPHGRVRSEASVLAALQRECAQLRQQCARQQSLLRLAQRAVGLPAAPPSTRPAGKKQRGRKPTVRALQAVKQLQQQELRPEPQTGVNANGVTP